MSITHREPLGGDLEILISDANPDGVETAPAGSLCLDEVSSACYRNTDGGTAWRVLAGLTVSLASQPTVNDDDTAGYAQGDLWWYGGWGLWACYDASTGAAVWVKLTGLVGRSTAPGASDDVSFGFDTGHIWYDSSTDTYYMLYDKAAAAAVWHVFYDGGGSVDYCANGSFRATYDFAVHGGAVGAIEFGPELPDNAYITLGYYQVMADAASPTGPNNATIGMGVATDDPAGLVPALAINNGGNEFLTAGGSIKPVTPDAAIANFTQQTSQRRRLAITVGVEDITAGRWVVWGSYGSTL